MTLIPVEEDGRTISLRFRKAPKFAFLHEGQIILQENSHRSAKSDAFFAHFDTLGVDTLYLKAIGRKTYEKLKQRKIKLYIVDESITRFNRITPQALTPLNDENIETFATLGHESKA